MSRYLAYLEVVPEVPWEEIKKSIELEKKYTLTMFKTFKEVFGDWIRISNIHGYTASGNDYVHGYEEDITPEETERITVKEQLVDLELYGKLKIWVLEKGKLKEKYSNSISELPIIEVHLEYDRIKIRLENGDWIPEKHIAKWNFMQTYQTAKRNCEKMNERLKMLAEKMKNEYGREKLVDILVGEDSTLIYESGLLVKDGFNLAALDKLAEKGVIIDDRDKKYD